MNNITLNLTLNEVNQLMEALGNMPYRSVFGLINKIHADSQGQLKELSSEDTTPLPAEEGK